MTSLNRLAVVAALCIGAVSLAGCSGMSRQTRDTAAGAAIGGVAGSVLTGGSTTGTVGGAVVGGVIGHENGKK